MAEPDDSQISNSNEAVSLPWLSNSGRFACSICGRTYKAKETLTRHENNHAGRVKHVCHDCGIGFHRKDLLARHRRLHQANEPDREPLKGRQRLHRACDHCRAVKIKCDSELPCNTCIRGGHECTYVHRSRRLSRGPHPSDSSLSVSLEENITTRQTSGAAPLRYSTAENFPDLAMLDVQQDGPLHEIERVVTQTSALPQPSEWVPNSSARQG